MRPHHFDDPVHFNYTVILNPIHHLEPHKCYSKTIKAKRIRLHFVLFLILTKDHKCQIVITIYTLCIFNCPLKFFF